MSLDWASRLSLHTCGQIRVQGHCPSVKLPNSLSFQLILIRLEFAQPRLTHLGGPSHPAQQFPRGLGSSGYMAVHCISVLFPDLTFIQTWKLTWHRREGGALRSHGKHWTWVCIPLRYGVLLFSHHSLSPIKIPWHVAAPWMPHLRAGLSSGLLIQLPAIVLGKQWKMTQAPGPWPPKRKLG